MKSKKTLFMLLGKSVHLNLNWSKLVNLVTLVKLANLVNLVKLITLVTSVKSVNL